MTVEERLIATWARKIAQQLADETIAQLQGMRDRLSGDDSGLENAWEEICVQVQGEESTFWASYEDVIDTCVDQRLEGYEQHEKVALWFATEDSWEWLEGHRARDLDVNSVPVDLSAITAAIRRQVLQAASDFENDRIYRFLWGEAEQEEPDDPGEPNGCGDLDDSTPEVPIVPGG